MPRHIAVFAASLLVVPAFVAVAAPQTPKPSKSAVLGDFSVKNWTSVTTELGRRTGTITMSMNGTAGAPVAATSARYDMTAVRLDLNFVQKPLARVTDATANGSVRIVIREPELNRKTILDCAKAVYTAGATKNQGKIVLTGGVRQEIQQPGGGYVLNAEDGVIEFVDADTTRVRLGPGSASGTIPDPTAKSKKP